MWWDTVVRLTIPTVRIGLVVVGHCRQTDNSNCTDRVSPGRFRSTVAYHNSDGILPTDLSSSLRTYEPSRSLRSSNEKPIEIPNRDQKPFGEGSFCFLAPSVWNSLPPTLRNVKHCLSSHPTPNLSCFPKLSISFITLSNNR